MGCGSRDTVSIRDNVAEVDRRIAAACARAGRKREEVTLVAVSKTFPAAAVDEALAAGVREIGENRVQEAREKKPLVAAQARWHLIGHLQSNKAKEAARCFDIVQTVDSAALGEKLARAAADPIEVLLQVNVGDEPQKSGVPRVEVEPLVHALRGMSGLRVTGLMAIPPAGTAEETRRWFRELRAMRDALGLRHLSMGMSDDYEAAIEEGSTIVRVGRAIFGSRS
jgi:pyridoxal phosphate enzyme (YggS family)